MKTLVEKAPEINITDNDGVSKTVDQYIGVLIPVIQEGAAFTISENMKLSQDTGHVCWEFVNQYATH